VSIHDAKSSHWVLDNGKRLIDPYLIWAQETQFRHFAGAVRNEVFVSLLIKLDGLGRAHDLLNKDEQAANAEAAEKAIFIDGIYLGRDRRLQIVGATVKPDLFLSRLREGRYAGVVQRFEFSDALLIAPTIEIEKGTDDASNSLSEITVALGIIDDGCPFAHWAFSDNTQVDKRDSRVKMFWDQSVYGLVSETPKKWRYSDVVQPFEKHESVRGAIKRIETNRRPKVVNAPNTSYGSYLNAETISDIVSRLDQTEVDEPMLYQAINYKRLRRSATHGSLVSSIAGGTTSGMATRSRIPTSPATFPIGFVQIPHEVTKDASGLWMAKKILDGLHVLIDSFAIGASESDRKLVVNVSYGPQHGPHDGSSLLEEAMVELLKAYEHLWLCVPTGNSFESQTHCVLKPENPATSEVIWRIPPDNDRPNSVELWIPEQSKNLSVTLTPPASSGMPALQCKPGEAKTLKTSDDSVIPQAAIIFPTQTTRCARGTVVLLVIGPTSASGWAPPEHSAPRSELSISGRWTISVQGESNRAKAEIRGYIVRNDINFGGDRLDRQSHFVDINPSSASSVQSASRSEDETEAVVRNFGAFNGMATGRHPKLWRVGGHVVGSKKPSRYSSDSDSGFEASAPTDQSANLPGITAAGSTNSQGGRLVGTSAASPQVARWMIEVLARGETPDPKYWSK